MFKWLFHDVTSCKLLYSGSFSAVLCLYVYFLCAYAFIMLFLLLGWGGWGHGVCVCGGGGGVSSSKIVSFFCLLESGECSEFTRGSRMSLVCLCSKNVFEQP